jgi:uncharacterized protein (DUF58 family)
VSRSAQVVSTHPKWSFGLLPRRLVWLEIALLVVAVIRPGSLSAAAAGLTLLVIAVLLAEPVPDEVDVSVSTGGRRVTAGEVVRLDVSVAFASGPAVPVSVSVLPAEEVEAAGRQPWRLVAGDDLVSLRMRLRRWMRGSVGHLRLRLTTPLGGRVGVVTLDLPSFVVHPRVEPSPGVYAPPQLLARYGTHTGRQRGPGTEFAELRTYVTGDPLRDIDWKSSARTRQLMVSQRYHDQAADVVVLVDHTSVVGGYDRRLHDRAVRGASTVARAYLAAGDRVGLVLFGSSVRWLPPGQGRMQQARILDQIVLRPVVASVIDPDLTRVPAVALPPRSIVFCFSSLLDDRMVAAIARLAERGHRLIVVDTIGTRPERWPAGTNARTQAEWPRHRMLLRTRLGEVGAIIIDDVNSIGVAVRGMARRGVAL